MTSSDDEGTNLQVAFLRHLGTPEERVAGLLERKSDESRAGRTPKQRARRARKTASINFRCSTEVRETAEALAAHFDVDLSEAVERAVLALAKAEKVKVQGGK